MKSIIMAALAVSFTTSTAFGAAVVWRSTTTGVLATATAPAPAPAPGDDDNSGGVDPSTNFGVSYPATTVRAGSPVTIRPSGPTSGISFEIAAGMPEGLILNGRSGEIIGAVFGPGTYSITVRLVRGGAYHDVPVLIIAI